MSTNYKPIISAIFFLFALSTSVSAAPGDLDATFGSGGRIPPPGGSQNISWATGVAVQPDQKIVGLGTDNRRIVLTRSLSDGTPDPSFGIGGKVLTELVSPSCGSFGDDLLLQPDGKIVVTGHGGCLGAYALRFLSDGTLDSTFDGDGKLYIKPLDFVSQFGYAFNTTTCRAALQTDGRLVLSCGEWMWEEDFWKVILRLNPNGSVDTTFGGGIGGPGRVYIPVVDNFDPFAVAIQPDGKIVAVNDGIVVLLRLNPDGSYDTSFGNSGLVSTSAAGLHLKAKALTLQPDNKIVVGGTYESASTTGGLVIRYLPNGSLDTSFGASGMTLLQSGSHLESVAVQSNGKIIAGGDANNQHFLARLLIDGAFDQTFGTNGQVATVFPNLSTGAVIGGSISDLAIQPDGNIIGAGGWGDPTAVYPFVYFWSYGDILWSYQAIARYTGDDVAPAACPNPIDCADAFVRQHYRDFLNREPDDAGLAFWTNEINSCGADAGCAAVKRINVSAAFFLSIEFQNTGYLVERMFKAAYGDATDAPTGLAVPVIRRSEFVADSALVGQGVVVNTQGWEQQLEANKRAYALAFVRRQRFTDAFPSSMNPAAFVAKLNENTGGALTQAEVDALVAELSASQTDEGRASVLRKVAENAEVERRERNRAFVLMQYFGYLRRNPDAAPDANYSGYLFWLAKLDEFKGDYVGAEMVKAFISSDEYRRRFGQP